MKTLKTLALLLTLVSSALYAHTNSNPNLFIPSVSSDFTSPNPANANKIWSIQQNFDLTTGNFIVPTGVELSFDGGSLTTTGTVTFEETLITAQNYKQIFDVGDVAGTVKDKISVNWFGLVGDGITDNRQTLLQAAKLVNASGGTAYVYNDTDLYYASSVVLNTVSNEDVPSNIVITGERTSWNGISNEFGQPMFKIIGHNLTGSELFATYELNNGSFKNIGIIGEREEHTPSAQGKADERNHNFVVGRGTYGLTIENCSFTKSTADGLYFINNAIFYNRHYSTEYTQGNIDFATGNIITDNDYMYSNVLFPVTNTNFTAKKKFMFMGGSYGTLFSPRIFHAVYYDAASNFIGKSEILTWYDEAEIPENCTQIRIVIPYTTENFQLHVACPFIAQQTKIINNHFSLNERQHISNPGQNTKIFHNVFELVGEKSPARAIDMEDGYQLIRHIEIAHNTFKNNHNGDIITKGSEYISIHDNVFDVNDKLNFTNGTIFKTNGTGLQTSRSYFTNINNNILKNRGLSIGYGSVARNNIIYNGELYINNQESRIEGGQYYNVRLVLNSLDFEKGNAYLSNASLFYDRPYDLTVFNHRGSLVLENVKIDFKNKEKLTGNPEIAKTYALAIDDTEPANGYIDGLTILNAEMDDTRKYKFGFDWYAQNISNLKSSVPLNIRHGKQRDLYLKNIDIKGRIWFRLDQYDTISNLKNITINDLRIDADHLDYDKHSAYIFETDYKNVNLYVNGGEIRTVSGISKMLSLRNIGTKEFVNFKFISADPIIIDLNSVASGGKVTFKNCYFSPNITLILRTGDEILNF